MKRTNYKKLVNSLKAGDAIVCQQDNDRYEVRSEKNYLENILSGEYEFKTESEMMIFSEFFTATIQNKIDAGKLLHGDRNAITHMTTINNGEEYIIVYLLKEEALKTDEWIAEITARLELFGELQMWTLIYIADERFPFLITDILGKVMKNGAA